MSKYKNVMFIEKTNFASFGFSAFEVNILRADQSRAIQVYQTKKDSLSRFQNILSTDSEKLKKTVRFHLHYDFSSAENSCKNQKVVFLFLRTRNSI